MKIVAKFDVQDVSFSITETELSKWQNPLRDVDNKNKSKGDQKNSEEKKNEKLKEIDGKSSLLWQYNLSKVHFAYQLCLNFIKM